MGHHFIMVVIVRCLQRTSCGAYNKTLVSLSLISATTNRPVVRPKTLQMERFPGNSTTLNDTIYSAKGQHLPPVVGDDHLTTRCWVSPLLVATTPRDQFETLLSQDPNNLLSRQPGEPLRHQAGISTSNTSP